MPSLLRYHKPFTEDSQKRSVMALGASGIEAADAFAEFTNKLDYLAASLMLTSAKTKFDQISKTANNRRFVRANPRPFKTEAETIDLLRMAA